MKRGISYAGLAGAIWGMVLMVPQVLPAFSPWLLSAVRFSLYGVISLLLALPLAGRIRAKLQADDVIMLAVLSLVGNLLYFILLAAAIQLVGIAPASLIVGVLPVTITLLGLKDEGALSLRQLAWPLLMVAGRHCLHQYRHLCRQPSGHHHRIRPHPGRTGCTGRTGQLELVCLPQCALSAPAPLL